MPRTRRKACPETDRLNARVGKTVARLRRAGDMSISTLSEASGVAKSMISAIEKNEANPSVATLFRLSQALGSSVESMLSGADTAVIEHARRQDVPLIRSEDGLCELRILGGTETVRHVQWYAFAAEPGGRLESSAHPAGSVENLSVDLGELTVTVDGSTRVVAAGETLRYRADRDHVVANTGSAPAKAVMVNILAHI